MLVDQHAFVVADPLFRQRRDLRGRRLWLRLTLMGHGGAAPEIAAVRAEPGEDQGLAALAQDPTTARPPCRRFAAVLKS